MKLFTYLAFLVTLMATNLSNAQVVVTYEQLSSATSKAKFKDFTYVTSLGDTLKVGDKVKFGNPSNANNSFVYIQEGNGIMSPAIHASIKSQGWESEIVNLRIIGSKRIGYSISVVGKTETGMSRYYYDYEKALSVGEIVSNVMTREMAITKLKESKDLLDLDMMTLEEYEAIKKELTPIIMNKS